MGLKPPAACSVLEKTRSARRLAAAQRSQSRQFYQLIINWLRNKMTIVHEFDAPKADRYSHSHEVVTVNREQLLLASVNGAQPVRMEMPYTVGIWSESTLVKATLKHPRCILLNLVGGVGGNPVNTTFPLGYETDPRSRHAEPDVYGLSKRCLIDKAHRSG